MGNCIGKKARIQNKHHCYSPSYHEQNTTSVLPLSSIQINIIHSEQSDIKRFNNDDKEIDQTNDNIEQSISTMGYLFSKEKDQEVPIFNQEIISGLFDTSPSSSLSDSSFSSYSSNSTSFSSDDQLILSSSSSHSNQIYLSSKFESLSNIFSISLSSYKKNFLYENMIFHHCQTLSSVIDDILQQQFIRIHRQTKTILIEHEQFQCIHLMDINQSDKPSLIFDENQKQVYITKYAHCQELQSISYNTKQISRFSSCDNCSLVLSGTKLNQYIRSFLIANLTYNLMQICFGDINKKNLFGYISQIDSDRIRQTIINNSKLNYSYDLDVDYTDIYFVLHVKSWPKEIRSIYEQRTRLWPTDIEYLFDRTCFIRYKINEYELLLTNEQCLNCKKIFSSLSNSSWSYTYAAIEGQLIRLMSNGQINFASILWNYLNNKTQGQLSFQIFKHTLFYFFEQYSSNSFTTNDNLFNQISCFINFLLERLQTKSIPHYFHSNYNLFNEKISINLLPITKTYFDLKHSSIYTLPTSSMYLYHLMYLIQFQSNFIRDFHSVKTNLTQAILDTHKYVIQQLSSGIKTYKQQLDTSIVIKSYRSLTLDCLYRYQEENVQIILDYLPLLRIKEPSLFIHLFWSIFIQYFNVLFDDLFIS